MSWLFSQALVAEYSAESCSVGEPSAPLSANPMPQAFLPSDRMMAFSRPSRFGMTFAPSTDGLGAELLTWFLAASRARTSAPQARAQESTGNAPACGDRWRELSVRYDRDSCSWRTHRSLWDEDLSACSLTLPKWGSMRDGVLSELQMLERPTAANDAGLWPTPNVPNGGRSCAHVTDWRGADGRTAYHNGKKVQVGLEHAAKHWQTPTASLGTKGGRVTPRKSREGETLIEAVSARKMWRTPSASVVEPKSSVVKLTGRKPTDPQVGLADQVGGSLNPTWVEWLMGWPLGWTDLKPLAMDRFRSWRQQHGGF